MKSFLFILLLTAFLWSCSNIAENPGENTTTADTLSDKASITGNESASEDVSASDDRLQTDKVILAIRKRFEKINAEQESYTQNSLESFEMSTEGGEITWYTDKKGKIVKIHHGIYGEMGRMEDDYYFDEDERLIFLFTQEFSYNAMVYLDAETAKESGTEAFDDSKTKISQNRFYFNEGKLYYWLDPEKKEVKDVSGAYNEKKQELYIYLDKIMEYIRTGKAEEEIYD